MSRLPRFLAVHIYRGHAIRNFDGVFEQLPSARFAGRESISKS